MSSRQHDGWPVTDGGCDEPGRPSSSSDDSSGGWSSKDDSSSLATSLEDPDDFDTISLPGGEHNIPVGDFRSDTDPLAADMLSRDEPYTPAMSEMSSVAEPPRTRTPCNVSRAYDHSKRYNLPCYFHGQNLRSGTCSRIFSRDEIEDWLKHCIGHFRGAAPPKIAICCCCDEQFEDSGEKCFEAMLRHLDAEHFRFGKKMTKDDPVLWKHLCRLGLISKDDFEARARTYRQPPPRKEKPQRLELSSSRMVHDERRAGRQRQTNETTHRSSRRWAGATTVVLTNAGDENMRS